MGHRSRTTTVLAVFALGLVVAAGGACKKAGDGDAPPGAASQGAAATAAFPKSAPALAAAPLLALVPSDAYGVVVVSDPAALLDALGREEAVKALGARYEQAIAIVTGSTGHNLLDPASWAAIGVDGRQPMGAAWLDRRDANGDRADAGMVVVTLSDAEKLKTWIDATLARFGLQLEKETVGDALVAFPKDDSGICLVIRGKQAAFVFANRDEAGIALARRVAGLAEAESLGADGAFREQLGRMTYGATAALWLDVPKLVRGAWKDEPQEDAGWATGDLERRLKTAKEMGLSAEEIADIEESIAQQKKWQQATVRRHKAERELGLAVFGGLGPLLVGFELGQQAITVKLLSPLSGGSLPGRLLKPGDGPPAVVKALGEPPLVLAAGTADPAALREAVVAYYATEYQDWDEVTAEVRAAIGVDLDADALPLLDGRVGAALTGRIQDDLHDLDGFLRSLGVAAAFGVKDEARAKALIATLAAAPLVAPLVAPGAAEDAGAGGLTLDIPDWRPLHVAVRGGYFVVTTDPGFAERVATGARGPYLAEQATPELRALLEMDDPAAIWAMDITLWGALIASFSFPMMDEMWDRAPPVGPGEPPYSAAYLAKLAELKALQKPMDETRKKRDDAGAVGLVKVLRLFGVTAFVGRREGADLVVYGGQYVTPKDLPSFTGEAIAAGLHQFTESERLEKEMWKLTERSMKLQDELRTIRDETLRRHAEEQRALAAPPGP